jgi:hypothetical protein
VTPPRGIANEQFLEAMFRDAPAGTHTIVTSFHGDPNTAGRMAWAGQPWAPGMSLSRGFERGFPLGNTYATVSAFTPDPSTGECRRLKHLFYSLHAVMIDDVGTKVAHTKILLAPSAIIETSPSNEQHYLFIRQDAAARDRATAEHLVDAMIRAGLTADSTDPGMKGVTRYGRLPVGINAKQKYVDQLGHPWRVRCLSFNPGRRYTIEEIADAYRIDLRRPTPRRSPARKRTRAETRNSDKQFAALLECLQRLGLYHRQCGAGPWHEVTCPWVHEHTDQADNGTAVSEPTAENGWNGAFRCHHSHGDRLHIGELRRFITRALIELARGRAA